MSAMVDYDSLRSPILKEGDKIPENHNFHHRVILELANESESGNVNPVTTGEIYADISYQLIRFMNRNPAFMDQIIQTLPSQTLKAMGALIANEIDHNRWLKVLEEREKATSAKKFSENKN
jgi:hypothetical protein